MAPGIHRGCLLLAICNLFVQISEAQLTGSLTHLTKEPELIKAVITNSGNITVSVLHHNNVFDNTSLSMPFRVVDQEGHKIPIAWTHIVHTAGSYLNLRPGEQFHRDFNLTDYIHFEPETQTITKNISISLPARVEGFEQTGKSIEDTPVNNRLSESIPPSFVTIDSKPLNLTWTSYAHHSSTEKRAVWNPPGINIVPGQCTGSDLGAMQNAILDASYLAGAGLNAAASFTLLPWTYFFKSDIGVSTTVAAVYQRLIQSQLGQGQTIAATCQDRYSYCSLRPGIAAYVAQSKLGSSHPLVLQIVFCPTTLRLPRNPAPCTANPGTISLGFMMVHNMVRVYSIAGPDLQITSLSEKSPRQVNAELNGGFDTTTDVNSYAYLAGWGWDLGLGGPPWNQKLTCLQNFFRGNFDAIWSVVDEVDVEAGDPMFSPRSW